MQTHGMYFSNGAEQLAYEHQQRKLQRRERLLCRAVNNLYGKGDSYRGREASRRLDRTRVQLRGEC